jgi:hypothetical protein
MGYEATIEFNVREASQATNVTHSQIPLSS